jgi:hypothetical protein
MADTAITAAEHGEKLSYKQTSKPRTVSGTFLADDTDFHVMELDMRVQGGLTYGATNPSNKDMVITLYGAFEAGVDPGDAAAFPIDATGFTVSAGKSAHETTLDKFPYYLVRCKFAASGDGSTVVVKACSFES